MNLAWLENLTKPFASLLNPVAERIGKSLGNRKPRLYVHFNLAMMSWSLGHQQQPDGHDLEMMHILLNADFNHDDDKQTLLIMDAFPEGTESCVPGLSRVVIPPYKVVNQQIVSFALPIIGEKEKAWTGRMVFVDQFQRRYKSRKATYRWVGVAPPSGSKGI
jgi:hypothetical protein